MKTAFLFPGQGSQYAGMAKKLVEAYAIARQVFAEADEALGFHLSRVILEGPDELLTKTENTQPALLATSTAYFRVLQEKGLRPDFVAGHSLGETSALVAAQALSLRDGLLFLRNRGRYMQEAVPAGEGAMAAMLGLEPSRLDGLLARVKAEDKGVIGAAALNSPGQIVLSGSQSAVTLACQVASDFGVRKATPLKVSAPFHCLLMKSAEEKLQKDLSKITFQKPIYPYVANATGEVNGNLQAIPALLLAQICLPVLWQKSVETLWESGVRRFVEVGPGNVLTGLSKRCLSKEQLAEASLENTDRDSDLAEIKGIHLS